MIYTVKRIDEDLDFGCEERAKDAPVMAVVTLVDSSGEELRVKAEDALLYKNNINELKFDSTFFEKPLCFLGVIAFLSSKNLYVHFIFLASLYCQYLFIITLPYNTNKYSDMSHLSYGIHSVQFQSAQILISRTNDVREHYFLPLH